MARPLSTTAAYVARPRWVMILLSSSSASQTASPLPTPPAHAPPPPPVPIDDKELKPEIKRFICNTISGELFRIPDIDGMKK